MQSVPYATTTLKVKLTRCQEMRFTAATALAVLAYVSGVTASPVAAEQELVVIGTDIVGGTELVWYGIPEHQDGNFTAPATQAKRDCGQNHVICSSSHRGPNNVCQALLDTLSSHSTTTVSRSPRAVCQGQGSNQCCTSWSVEVTGNLQYGHLYSAASSIISQCNSGGGTSGLARDVNLGMSAPC